MLSGLTAESLPSDVMELPAGTAYLLNTSGDLQRVNIPLVQGDDLARIAEMLGSVRASGVASAPTSAEPARRPFGFRAEGAAEGAAEVPTSRRPNAEQWSVEEAAIVAALAAGKKPGELAEELSGAKGGRAYQVAAAKVQAVIARLALLTRAA
jgi:hypothetical protein